MTLRSIPTRPPSPTVIGILNVTPDSFYDGGNCNEVEAAVSRAQQMVIEGANIIDIGGESTGPGSVSVSEEEEMERVLSVVDAILKQNPKAHLSIDTYKASVAKEALKRGAAMINDVTAGRADPNMFATVAEANCQYVLMRSKDDAPRTTVRDVSYDDVMQSVSTFFEERLEKAERAGIRREHIILDPGLGHFVSSDAKYSWEILERLTELQCFGCRILVSPSRKSFTAAFEGQPPSERLEGTLKATKIALKNGVNIIRTHDIAATKTVAQSILTTDYKLRKLATSLR